MSLNRKEADGSTTQVAGVPYITKENIGLSNVENKSSEQIRDEITKINVINALDVLNPDKYEGTDAEKLQKAFDHFINTDGGTILIDRKYNITSDVIIKRHAVTDTQGNICVIGIGERSELNFTNSCIKGNDRFCGGVKFINVTFNGNRTCNACFECSDNLIRMYFISCRFERFIDVIYINGLLQQWRFTQCYFEENTGKCFNGIKGSVYCLTVDSCDFEHNGTAFWFNNTETFNANDGIVIVKAEITKCVIENNDTVGIRLSNYTKGMTISDCYFEANPISVDMRQCLYPVYTNGIYIANNIIDLPNNGIGFYVPASSGHISALPEQKLAIFVNNNTHANGNTGGELIAINGEPSNHNLYYDIDTIITGQYPDNSTVSKAFHKYNLKYHQFYVTTNKEIKSGDIYPIMTGSDFISATGSTALEFFCQIRNGLYPCAVTRNPVNQALEAMFFVDVPSGTTMTFNLAYRN